MTEKHDDQTAEILSFQPELRPELPLVDGPKEYREQRELLERLDEILGTSGLENDFFELSVSHQEIELSKLSAAQRQSLRCHCTLAFRSNLLRGVMGLPHRDFCIRLADSALCQWFLQIGRVDGASTFAKSTSDRFAHFIDADSLKQLNVKLMSLLSSEKAEDFELKEALSFEEIFFDSTCVKVPVHYPVDWVLLRDATRTLMKAVTRIRKEGLLSRMPKAPLEFLSEMNSLCMAMTGKDRTSEGKKQRKKVYRQMKALLKRVEKHAQRHLALLRKYGEQTELAPGHIENIIKAMQNVLDQIPDVIKQAHERIIGERKLSNNEKVLSLYDADVEVIKRGKSNGEVEFGNNLWLGETRDGFIADYLLEKEKTSDSKQIESAIERLVDEQSLPVGKVWGDRGLHSKANEKLLSEKGIYSGLCPKSVNELSERLEEDEAFGQGLKRRAGTEARISIVIRKFMGTPPRTKGFEHREMMVGWAVLTHNLWKLARLEKAEAPPQEEPLAA